MSLKKLNKNQLIERVNVLQEAVNIAEAESNSLKSKLNTAENKLNNAECYLGNVQELISDINVRFTASGDLIKVDFKVFRDFIQIVWNKVKESSFECRNTEIKVKTKFWVRSVLSIIGFKL